MSCPTPDHELVTMDRSQNGDADTRSSRTHRTCASRRPRTVDVSALFDCPLHGSRRAGGCRAKEGLQNKRFRIHGRIWRPGA